MNQPLDVHILFSCGTKAVFQAVTFELETIDCVTYRKDSEFITIYKRNLSYVHVFPSAK